jgi:hypothetical protein
LITGGVRYTVLMRWLWPGRGREGIDSGDNAMNVKRLCAGLVLAATVLAGGCAHDCCRPKAAVTGRPCCPPGGAVAPVAPAVPTVPAVPAIPAAPVPATSGFTAVPAPGCGCQ